MKTTPFTCLILLLYLSKGVFGSCPSKCECNGQNLQCYKTLPESIPNNIKEVIAYEVPLEFNFSHPSWAEINSLSINPEFKSTLFSEQNNSRILHNYEFSSLKNLKYLQIACDCLEEIEQNAFHGLNQLKVLDLSNNEALKFDSLFKAFMVNGTLQNLTELYLSRSAAPGHKISISQEGFRLAMKDKPIKVLDISNFNNVWFFLYIDIFTSLPFIVKLNLSNSAVDYMSLIEAVGVKTAIYLRVLDISYPTPLISFTSLGQDYVLHMYTEYLKSFNLTELHAKKIFQFQSRIDGRSNLTHICIDIMYPDGTRKDCISAYVGKLEKLVISDNSVTYIQPEIWNGFESLRYLDISKNSLGAALLEYGYGSTFLDSLHKLEVLILAENKIHELSRDTFKNSKSLKILDLSGNELKSIEFETHYLLSLQRLDLRHNQIVFLDETSLGRLNNLLQLSDNRKTITVRLAGNLFDCSCENVDILYWLGNLNESNKCMFKSETKSINTKFLQHMQYACREKVVIAVYSTLAGVTVILVAILVFFIIRDKRRLFIKRQIIQGIEKFRLEKNDKKIPPVFLSFCSEDDEIVMNEILPYLDEGLKKILNTETRCVSTGYQDFRPGLPLGDEIIRCVEASSVIIFFVTNAFCRKMWCRNEALIAHYDNKPTVLMMWEKVDMAAMPKHLYKCYQEYVRVHWVYVHGQRLMRPDWEQLCEVIVRQFAQE